MITGFYIPLIIILSILFGFRGKRILYNDKFWLILWWCIILGVYLASGIQWGDYGLSKDLLLFLSVCCFFYFSFRKLGTKCKIREVNDKECVIDKRIIASGYLGLGLFIFDWFRLNELGIAKSSYSLSVIGTVGMLFVPILLVFGIYSIGDTLVKKQKISITGVISLVFYSIPCLLNSGRQNVLYIIVAIAVIWAIETDRHNIKILISARGRKMLLAGIFCLVLLIYVIYSISLKRIDENYISTFLNTHDVPWKVREEANKFGPFKFLYYNVLSYFGHQIPYLDVMIHQYSGPYLGGMFQLNIISRRLPSFLGLDYRLAWTQISYMISQFGGIFNASWFTVLGAMIVDFSVIFTPAVLAFLGLLVGIVRRKFIYYDNLKYDVLYCLICIMMFDTIIISPFYNFSTYGGLIWWALLFKKKPRKNI